MYPTNSVIPYNLPSPANLHASSASTVRQPSSSSTTGIRKKSVYRHEPYNSGLIITPAPEADMIHRSVHQLLSPMYQPFRQTSSDEGHQMATVVVVTPRYRHRRYATLSSTSTSTDSLDMATNSVELASALGDAQHSVATMEDTDKCFLPSLEHQQRLQPISVGHCAHAPAYPQQTYSTWPYPAVGPDHVAAARPALIPNSSAVLVAFKYGKKKFFTPFPLEVNEMVIVEGDRGIDMGVVEAPAHHNSRTDGRLPKVLRRPNAEDVQLQHERAQREVAALLRLKEV